jgi:hypothetical protein
MKWTRFIEEEIAFIARQRPSLQEEMIRYRLVDFCLAAYEVALCLSEKKGIGPDAYDSESSIKITNHNVKLILLSGDPDLSRGDPGHIIASLNRKITQAQTHRIETMQTKGLQETVYGLRGILEKERTSASGEVASLPENIPMPQRPLPIQMASFLREQIRGSFDLKD